MPSSKKYAKKKSSKSSSSTKKKNNTVFDPSRANAARLTLKSTDKNFILEALNELQVLKVSRSTSNTAAKDGSDTNNKIKIVPRKIARDDMLKQMKKELKEDKKKDAERRKRDDRKKGIPTASKVRINLGILLTSEKKLVVLKRCDNLKEIFKTTKTKFSSKKAKLKKPSRAFCEIEGRFEEIEGTDNLCNDDLVIVTENGEVPPGFMKEKNNDLEANDDDDSVTDKNDIKVSKLRTKYHKMNNKNKHKDTLSKEDIESETKYLLNRHKDVSQKAEFQNMLTHRSNLPAAKFRAKVIDTLSTNQVMVISGATGCGKTTQIPQFILEHFITSNAGGLCNIICTQPRRISAIGVAERVAVERSEKIGDVIGYQIRLDSRLSKHTRINFCTIGILLRRLSTNPTLEGISHILLDEVHEREMLSDFILVILKDLLKKRKDLKIVLMSATLNSDMFSQYFNDCPTIDIPGRTYPVEKYGLETILDLIKYKPSPEYILHGSNGMKLNNKNDHKNDHNINRNNDSNKNTMGKIELKQTHLEIEKALKHCSLNARSAIDKINERKINYDLIVEIVKYICKSEKKEAEARQQQRGRGDNDNVNSDGKAILIFLPGVGEIRQCYNALYDHLIKRNNNYLSLKVLQLHGSLRVAEQRLVFKKFPGYRKVVLSTNIAETSITIEDISYVIDTGKVKETRYDQQTRCQALVETWVSRANALQRMGRAGRVAKGKCFQLYSIKTSLLEMLPYQIPEIQRTSLEHVILQVHLLGLGAPIEFLMKTVDPPLMKSITSATKRLQELKALDIKTKKLTPLGLHLANLPCEAGIGKMLIYGTIFSCIEPVLTIAAGLSVKSPFVVPMSRRADAQAAKMSLAKHNSDLLTLVNVYNEWSSLTTYREKRQYCDIKYLSHATLDMMRHLRKQFCNLLRSAGFLGHDNDDNKDDADDVIGDLLWNNKSKQYQCNKNGSSVAILRSVITAGLYPNVIRINKSEKRGRLKFTTQKETINIHPSSVNFKCQFRKKKWMVYHQKQQTSQIYVYDSTVITARSLLLFGGEMNFNFDTGTIQLDDWISFKSSPDVWKIMSMFREELDYVLEKRLGNPFVDGNDLDNSETKVINIMVKFLESENNTGAPNSYINEDIYFKSTKPNLTKLLNNNNNDKKSNGGGFKYVENKYKKGQKNKKQKNHQNNSNNDKPATVTKTKNHDDINFDKI
jgi:ATP-dependent RNA helicase DHX57